MLKTTAAMCALGLAVAAIMASPNPVLAADGAKVILNTQSFYRCYVTWKREDVRRESGELETMRFAWRKLQKVEPRRSPAPSSDWRKPEFDDSGWIRTKGPFGGPRTMASRCLRGKFEVKNPAEVGDLSLDLVFRGGVIVYVNGKELTRSHMPAGKLDIDTPATDYPEETYVDPDGFLLRNTWGDPKKYKDRFAKRVRKLTGAKIPASMLRKGTNVLAVEMHRSPTAEVFYKGKPRKYSKKFCSWSMFGLNSIRLTASADASATPNLGRPEGVQVWNHPVVQKVSVADYGDPNDSPRPIDLRGTRGGTFSGRIVVGARKPLRGIKVAVTELKGTDGSVIPASCIAIRYARADGTLRRSDKVRMFDALDILPPAEVPVYKNGGSVQPVWITVSVPVAAKAGKYTGKVTVSVQGIEPVEVPLKLNVSDWAIHDSKQFVTHVGLVQSPETLSIRYNVPMWSAKHWELIGESFKLMARAGNKVIYIPLQRRSYFGNDHTMVRWIKDGNGWKHDFSIAEKYIDLAVKHMGTIPVVCLYAWEITFSSTYQGTGGKDSEDKYGMRFTVLDPATGKLSDAEGPKWGTPEVITFWKPVFDGMRKLLAKREMAASMMVGIGGDRTPSKTAVGDLKTVAPDAKWVVSSHPFRTNLYGQPIGYLCHVWGIKGVGYPALGQTTFGGYHGWKNPFRVVAFPRYGSNLYGPGLRPRLPLAICRLAAETAIASQGKYKSGGLRGFGRCGADFWPVIGSKRRAKVVLERFPETSGWHGGWIKYSTQAFLAPGEDGPISTVRFEMIVEGVQEAEARIFIEKAMIDNAARAKLGSEMAARCQAMLDERVRVCAHAIIPGCVGSRINRDWYVGSGWNERSQKLYDTAAEVAGKLGK